MRIALLKTSLIDYPGRLACVVFLPGCDLACPFCHNPELARPKDYPGFLDSLIEEEELEGFLKKRRNVLQGVVFSGGEALIHPGFSQLLGMVRVLGYPVKIDTNGMHPKKLEAAAPDFVAMDMKTDPAKFAALVPQAPAEAEDRIRACLSYLRRRGVQREIRSTLVPGFIGKKELGAIGAMLAEDETWALQRFRPGKTLDPAFSNLSPYSEEEIQDLYALAKKLRPRAILR